MVHPDFAVIPASAQVETASTVREFLREGFEMQSISFAEKREVYAAYKAAWLAELAATNDDSDEN